MGTEEPETDRATVQTYVPTYQKDRWQGDADHMDMSLSEFVRTMVQAGRRGFVRPEQPTEDRSQSVKPPSVSPDDGLDAFVHGVLAEDECRSWDGLVDDLEAALQRLQDENRVAYSGRRGGYTLTDE